MFWKNTQQSATTVDVLLNKEDVTLRELLDEDYVIQECKSQNKKLVDFLTKQEVMEELVMLTVKEPSIEFDECVRFKYPNIACELLTCEIPALNGQLASHEVLEKFYDFLKPDQTLNPLLASYVSRILGILVRRRGYDQPWCLYQIQCLSVLEFMKSKGDFFDLLLKHIGTSSIMDLILKIIVEVEGSDMRLNLVTWLESDEVIPKLIGLLHPSVDSKRHFNVSQLICDIIRRCRENLGNQNETDPILQILQSQATVSQVLDQILNEEKSESAIVGGISILLTLMEIIPTRPDEGDVPVVSYSSRPEIINTTSAIFPRLKNFHDLLLNPPKKPPVKTTVGVLDPPFGSTRLQIAKLIASLMLVNHTPVNQELVNLGTVDVLLDLFFKYEWNNFLHTQVQNCINCAVQQKLSLQDDGDLMDYILVNCQLVEKILEAFKQSGNGSKRCGYMGHLANIANMIDIVIQHPDYNGAEKIPSDILSEWNIFQADSVKTANELEEEAKKFRPVPKPENDVENPQIDKEGKEDLASYAIPICQAFDLPSTFDEQDENESSKMFEAMCSDERDSFDMWNSRNPSEEDDKMFSKSQTSKDGADNSSSDEEAENEDDYGNDYKFKNSKRNGDDIFGSAGERNFSSSDFNNPWCATDSDDPQVGWADFSSFETNFNSADENKPSFIQQLATDFVTSPVTFSATPVENETEAEALPETPASVDEQISCDADVIDASSKESSQNKNDADSNANLSPRVEDVTPAATAIIDDISAAAVATVSATLRAAEKGDLDNHRFLDGKEEKNTSVEMNTIESVDGISQNRKPESNTCTEVSDSDCSPAL